MKDSSVANQFFQNVADLTARKKLSRDAAYALGIIKITAQAMENVLMKHGMSHNQAWAVSMEVLDEYGKLISNVKDKTKEK